MNIVIIANFPHRMDGAREKGRFLYLGEMLCERGHIVEMIVSDFDHGLKKHRVEGSIHQNTYKTKITTIHEPGYPNNISVKRLLSHYIWGRNVDKYLRTIKAPDVIYCAVPSLTAGVRAAKYCRHNRIRFIIDVQDLWPEAFQMAVKNKILQSAFLPIKWYANRIYKAADNVVAVSDTYVRRALSVNNKDKLGLCVFLGNDGQLFDESKEAGRVITSDCLKVAYIGSLSYSYDIPCVLDAIKLYCSRPGLPRIKFVVMGDGVLRKEFEQKVIEDGIDCVFTGSLPYNEMVANLCTCDIVVNPIVASSAASIINKVGDYALSGLPVINTQENPEYRKLVEDYNCGINCRVGDSNDVAKALMVLAKDESLRKSMGANARKLGLDRFDRRVTYKRIVDIIEDHNV